MRVSDDAPDPRCTPSESRAYSSEQTLTTGARTTSPRRCRGTIQLMSCRNGQGDTENPQGACPGDQRDRAGAWRDQVMDSQAHECVRSTGWHEPPHRRDEAEQEVVDDEAPGE